MGGKKEEDFEGDEGQLEDVITDRMRRRCGRVWLGRLATELFHNEKRHGRFWNGRRLGRGTGVLGCLWAPCQKIETPVGIVTEAWCMAKWAGDGKDWVQEMTMHPPKKDEVIVALLMMTRQLAKQLTKKRRSSQ